MCARPTTRATSGRRSLGVLDELASPDLRLLDVTLGVGNVVLPLLKRWGGLSQRMTGLTDLQATHEDPVHRPFPKPTCFQSGTATWSQHVATWFFEFFRAQLGVPCRNPCCDGSPCLYITRGLSRACGSSAVVWYVVLVIAQISSNHLKNDQHGAASLGSSRLNAPKSGAKRCDSRDRNAASSRVVGPIWSKTLLKFPATWCYL